MVYQLNGHEFEQAPGDGDGQASLVCCSPWGCKESDKTEQLNNNSGYRRMQGNMKTITMGQLQFVPAVSTGRHLDRCQAEWRQLPVPLRVTEK